MESIDTVLDVDIVRVVSECRLLDSRSKEQVYWRRDGVGLAPGYYIIRRGSTAARNPFNEEAEFRGPFRSCEAARTAMDELVARLAARAGEAQH